MSCGVYSRWWRCPNEAYSSLQRYPHFLASSVLVPQPSISKKNGMQKDGAKRRAQRFWGVAVAQRRSRVAAAPVQEKEDNLAPLVGICKAKIEP